MSSFSIKRTYSFDVYPSEILGASYKNVVVTGIMDEESARKLINTREMHVAVYPFLPMGTPNDPSVHEYIQIKTPAGNTVVLSTSWIKENTIEEVVSQTLVVKVYEVSASDIPRLRNALLTSGFKTFTIDVQ